MKTILSSDYFLSRIVRILGEIGFVPGCLILLVLMTMSSFASAHHLPNSIKDHKSFDPTTSFEIKTRAYDSRIKKLTPWLDEEHPHGGSISFPAFHSNLHCHPDEGRISFYPLPSTFYPITGTIYDAGGGIPGVVIKIKGTNIFTITDEFGQFQIDAQKGDTLIISYPDYETIEVPITEQTEINLELFPAVTQLEEAVINAGYYTVKDKERTGSIYKVTAKEIENQPVNNVLDALQGRVPGLDITPTTGLAGGGYTVRIRGQNSISAGNDPLYIIDGMPYNSSNLGSQNVSGSILPRGNINPLNTIDPSIIESVEVLKDADATSIYGSQGANGVILITTKKGKLKNTSFYIDASTTFVSVAKMLKLLNTEQYIRVRKQAYINDGNAEYFPYDYDINGTWDQTRFTDWQKKFYGNIGVNNTIKFNISGGSENTQFIIGSSTTKETTVFPFDYNYKRFNFFTNLNHISNNKRLKLQFSGSFGQDQNYLPATDLTNKAISLPPNAPPLYDSQGELNWENSTWENPYAALASYYRNKSYNLFANSNISYEILNNLFLKTNIGYTKSELLEENPRPHTRFNPSIGLTSSSSSFLQNNSNQNTWNIEPQINTLFKIGSGKINFLIGGTFQEQNISKITQMGMDYPDNRFINNFSAAKDIHYLNDENSQYKYIAGYTRANLNLLDKYYLNLTARVDGSSRFGPGKKFANFSALGFAWIISKEKLLENFSWLNMAKLRGSIGTSGNDQIGNYQYLNTYSLTSNFYNDNIGLSPTRLYNPNYAWEKNRKFEISLQTAILKNQIEFELSYYRNKSYNLLVNAPQPTTTGFNSINTNLNAKVINQGWELNVSASPLINEKLIWKMGLNFALPESKLLEFPNLESSPYVNTLELGYPLNIYKLYKLIGVNSQTGLFEFYDYNNDGKITSIEDKKFIADLNPKIILNFTNNLIYKNWNLNFSFEYVKRNAFNELYNTIPAGFSINQPTSVLDSWQNIGDNTFYQMYTSGNNQYAYISGMNFSTSSGVVSDASYLKLKNISLEYKILISQKNSTFCSIYFQGQNLITFSKFSGLDPTQINGFLPSLKRYSIGAKITL